MRLLVVALLCCLAPLAQASEEAMQRFTRLMGDPALRQQAYEAGQERIRFCGHCHGENGNSKRDYIPNLAAQSPVYLFHSFEKFANGERTDFVMSKLAQTLTLEDRVNVAVYFSQQKVLPSTAVSDAALRHQGELLFQQSCSACHGSRGEGRETMPRLAGQSAVYVRKALTRFRDNDPSRAGSVMMSIARDLSEPNIQALAAYLEQLQVD